MVLYTYIIHRVNTWRVVWCGAPYRTSTVLRAHVTLPKFNAFCRLIQPTTSEFETVAEIQRYSGTHRQACKTVRRISLTSQLRPCMICPLRLIPQLLVDRLATGELGVWQCSSFAVGNVVPAGITSSQLIDRHLWLVRIIVTILECIRRHKQDWI